MAVIGLAVEGPTDLISIENILLGVFENLEDNQIAHCQPRFDKSDENSKLMPAGWNRLLSYLCSRRFKEDLINHEYMIIHIDTDIAEEKHADITIKNDDGKRLPDHTIVKNAVNRLITAINVKDAKLFDSIKEKVIFAITVDSLECWLINAFVQDDVDVCKHGGDCFQDMKKVLLDTQGMRRVKKQTKIYDDITRVFYEQSDIIDKLANRDVSFKSFLKKLNSLPI